MSKKQSMSAEEQLEVLREKLAPTIARIAIQIYRDGERMKALEARRPRDGGPKAA